MKLYKLWAISLLLPFLSACQSEVPQENNIPESPVENENARKIRVKASVPASNETRAQITYGNPNIEEEIFLWNTKDWITIFNITKLSECPLGVQLEEIYIDNDNRSAEFESITAVDKNFQIEPGDVILATYGETLRKYTDDPKILDERNIFTLVVGTEANKPQYILPNNSSSQALTDSLYYMKHNLKMFAIVVAEENGKIPDIHFNHLSSIFRITLHNATGEDLYPTKLEFDYPTISTETDNNEEDDSAENNAATRNEGNREVNINDPAGPKLSFFNTTLYFSVVGNEAEGYYLNVYDTYEFFKGSNAYNDKIGTTINGKSGTSDAGSSIKNGETYDLYITTVPRIGNDSKGDKLNILLTHNHETATDKVYKCTIEGFDKVIEPGLRYWFKLTATPDSKLVRSSQWNPETQTIK